MKGSDFKTRREYWKALMKEQEGSGLTQAEFCKAKGISKSGFYNWRSSIKKQKDLVRVEVVDDVAEPMRIVFGSGVALHFAQTPEPEWIIELMKLVS
jgi:hypothetical protein